MLNKHMRTKRFLVERLQLWLLFAVIFAAPLYTGFVPMDSDYTYAYALSLLAFSLPLLMVRSARTTPLNIENWRAVEIILLIVLSTIALTYYGIGTGLIDRASTREGITNTNLSGSLIVTLVANSNFIVAGIAAYLVRKGLDTRKRKYLYVGVALAATMLTITGTRYLFLLALSPLLYAFFFDSRYLRKLLVLGLAVAASSFVAIARSGFNINFAALLYYDLPSTASALAVQGSEPPLENIGYFFIGNILVLVPRGIFPKKPVDPTTIDFTILHLGIDAFNIGATYLPGFIGSAWLYGAWIVVAIFSFLLGYLFLKSFPNDQRASSAHHTLKALLFIGLILQFRNISIFYLLPYFFTAIGILSTSSIRSILPRKHNI